jgi:hypothetical protein
MYIEGYIYLIGVYARCCHLFGNQILKKCFLCIRKALWIISRFTTPKKSPNIPQNPSIWSPFGNSNPSLAKPLTGGALGFVVSKCRLYLVLCSFQHCMHGLETAPRGFC